MISTAGYYCSNGHVWESTTSTEGHDTALRFPCVECIMRVCDGHQDDPGSVHGPFPDWEQAFAIAQQRGVEIREVPKSRYPCPTDYCGGDGRYAAPGRGHRPGCIFPRSERA